MVIRAVFENGVFRPTDPVELPENCQVELQVDEVNPTISQMSSSTPLARLAAIGTEYPENPKLPTDLAEQHDSYLYGVPRRP